MTDCQIQSSSGTYILLVELLSPTAIEIGRLGQIRFEAGISAYVGSAFGPGGLAARLRRYTTGPRRTHWHIDYLLEHANVRGALVSDDSTRLECQWSGWLAARARAWVPDFGSSDCRCASHLFFVGDDASAEEMVRAAGCDLKASTTIGGR